jgi:hypothetical protein
VDNLLDVILWDRRILIVPDNITAPVREVVILYPTLSQKRIASFYKDRALADARRAGVPGEAEIMQIALAAKAWTSDLEALVREGEKRIASLESDLHLSKFLTQKKKLKKRIEEIRKEFAHATHVKNLFVSKSAERLADTYYVYHLMMQIVYMLSGGPLFPTEADLLRISRDSVEFFYFLMEDVLNDHFLGIAEIRQVARSVDWRMLWTLQKENLAALFGRPIMDLTLNQKTLIYWSRLYDLAFDAYENKPDTSVIEDDERFDEWLHNYVSDKKSTGVKNKDGKGQERGIVLEGEYVQTCTCGVGTKSPGLGERPQHINGCMFGVMRLYTEEEKRAMLEEIYNRNPEPIRQIHAREADFIEKNKVVDERQLRNKRSRQILGLGSKVHPMHGR